MRGASTTDVDLTRKLEVVEAFLAASRAGDFEALVAVLDPEVVLRSDAEGMRLGGPAELRGAAAVAAYFRGRAQAAIPGLVNGEIGILVPVHGRVLFVLEVTLKDGRIATIDGVADRKTIASLELEEFTDGG